MHVSLNDVRHNPTDLPNFHWSQSHLPDVSDGVGILRRPMPAIVLAIPNRISLSLSLSIAISETQWEAWYASTIFWVTM